MGKRQIRISNPDQIQNRIGEFIQKHITAVLTDNTTTFGILVSVNGDSVVIKNGRGKKNLLPLQKISEIYTDIDA